MNKWEDMIGRKYGRLTVVCRAPKGIFDRVAVICECDCGNKKIIRAQDIRLGKANSCGCLRQEVTSKRFKKHGDSKKRLYSIWSGMRSRCFNENIKSHKNYGQRGISICKEWGNYKAFRSWAILNGYKDNLTIERINVNGDYTPENCTWVPFSLQGRNRRDTTRYLIGKDNKPLVEWCALFNVPLNRAHKRIYSGCEPFTVEELYKTIRREII